VSRTVAVGLALKRLYPESRVLVISGSSKTGMIVGPGSLDWIKLPSYQTVLTNGVSEGRDGDSGYYKSVLGNLRADMLRAMVEILKPHCVLVDHNPFGKRKELLKALDQSIGFNSQWILGLRGIVGDDKNLWSVQSIEVVQKYYREIIWYGDSDILGAEPLDRIKRHFKQNVTEMGYVSRLLEVKHFIKNMTDKVEKPVCTVSIPWLGEQSGNFIHSLYHVIRGIGSSYGKWHIYVSETHIADMKVLFEDLSFCLIEPISDRYIRSLLHSQSAIIYGGYNSVLDVVAAELPVLVVLRSTRDGEQQDHLHRLSVFVGNNWQIVEEEKFTDPMLEEAVRFLLSSKPISSSGVDFSGAEKTAKHLHQILKDSK